MLLRCLLLEFCTQKMINPWAKSRNASASPGARASLTLEKPGEGLGGKLKPKWVKLH